MDLATLIGFLLAWSLIIGTIAFGAAASTFINMPSFMIVLGGTFAVVMMRFTLKQFINSIKTATRAFLNRSVKPQDVIEEVVQLASVARKEGLLALERQEVSNPALALGVRMLVDGHDPSVVRKAMMTEMNGTVSRHQIGQQLFQQIGDAAPAMGMIGTLVGLVQMLSNMSDPRAIGPAMAIALLTTLYGAMIANMFALPIADKLALRSSEELMIKNIIIESVMGIQEGQNPKVLEELLKNFLPASDREREDLAAEAA
ncbi:Flagellar motor rotation protein MotA [Methylophaga frappieri]|uniref:Flagellar motor rotation protein MotA n=1 Tax=Methylophaga frappieri (strain ATCC BAA-2434 / DSM 25690 / JAM7) TaxID=754477 RepID=I1YL46_METFJ|nr:flagellar motor protein PomA [Methylophaga frappieri]AFJ03639.1 Flagellar motor rotation protein MotA [Methylophaga frappieri]